MASPALTQDDITREMEAEAPARPLYNPSNQWLEGQYNSFDFPIPPDGEALNPRTGKVETSNGVLGIRDVYGWEYAKDTETGKLRQTGGRTLHATSINIVRHLMKRFGPMGLVRLTGDPRQDEAIKSKAREKWIKHRIASADSVIEGRNAYLREFHANPANAGQIPDAPNALVTEALELKAQYRLGLIGRKTFACRHDGYQTDDAKKWQQHYSALHPNEPLPSETGAETGKRKSREKPSEPTDDV